MDTKTLKELTEKEIERLAYARELTECAMREGDDAVFTDQDSAALAAHISNWLRLDDLVPETDAEALWVENRAMSRELNRYLQQRQVLIAVIRMLCVAGINEQEDLLEDARALFSSDDAGRDLRQLEDFLREAIGKLQIHGAGFKGEELVDRVTVLLKKADNASQDSQHLVQQIAELTERLAEVDTNVGAELVNKQSQKQSVST